MDVKTLLALLATAVQHVEHASARRIHTTLPSAVIAAKAPTRMEESNSLPTVELERALLARREFQLGIVVPRLLQATQPTRPHAGAREASSTTTSSTDRAPIAAPMPSPAAVAAQILVAQAAIAEVKAAAAAARHTHRRLIAATAVANAASTTVTKTLATLKRKPLHPHTLKAEPAATNATPTSNTTTRSSDSSSDGQALASGVATPHAEVDGVELKETSDSEDESGARMSIGDGVPLQSPPPSPPPSPPRWDWSSAECRHIDGFILDCDGTLYEPEGLIEGATDLLRWLHKRDIPFVLLSNTARCSEAVEVSV